MKTDVTIWIGIIVLFAAISSCKAFNKIIWHQAGTDISKDTIHIQVYQDSTHLDTIRYAKRYHYTESAPRTIKGTWYIIGVLVIAFAVLIFYKNN